VIVAPGIEDFQVRYVLTDQNPGEGNDSISLGALSSNNQVRQLNIGLVSRSHQHNRTSSSIPISLFNHTQSPQKDGFSRNVLTGMVHLRNY
jgi:hypothetical protein